MPNLIRISVLAASMMAVTASAYAEDVDADAPHEERRASVAALLGVGFDLTSDDFNPFGFGIGAAGGYSFDSGVYLGGQFMYFFGDSETVLATDLSVNIVSLGVEGGYNLRFDPLIVRPTLGVGVAFYNTDVGDDVSSVYFAPGATVIYPIKQFFVGGDARLWLVTGNTRTALSLLATGGITF